MSVLIILRLSINNIGFKLFLNFLAAENFSMGTARNSGKEIFLFLYETLHFRLIFSMFHYIMCFKPTPSLSRGLKPSARLGA